MDGEGASVVKNYKLEMTIHIFSGCFRVLHRCVHDNKCTQPICTRGLSFSVAAYLWRKVNEPHPQWKSGASKQWDKKLQQNDFHLIKLKLSTQQTQLLSWLVVILVHLGSVFSSSISLYCSWMLRWSISQLLTVILPALLIKTASKRDHI